MKSLARQDVLADRNSYATSPQQYQRPSFQSESYRNVERPSSQKQPSYVMDNKENTLYKYQLSNMQTQHKQSVRPSSSNIEKQSQTAPRTFSSTYDKRDNKNTFQMHVTSAPALKKMALDQRLKKEVSTTTMKNSVLVAPMPSQVYQHTPNTQYSQQKSNRFFSNNSDQVEYQSVPTDNRQKPLHHQQQQKPSISFVESMKPPQQSVSRKNETEGDGVVPKKSQDYQEYRQLQDKLQYLENKIISIKSNIDNSNSQLAKNSSRFKKDTKVKGLTAKFFGDNKKKQEAPPTQQVVGMKGKHKQEQSNPSLSSFITQVKQNSTAVVVPSSTTMDSTKRKDSGTTSSSTPINVLSSALKNLLTKPESAKASSTTQQQKKPFTRKASQETQKYPIKLEPTEPFLFYVSSVIRAFMSSELTRTIEQSREHVVQTIQAIQFAKTMKATPQHLIDEKKVYFQKRDQYRNKKTLVFDLDETLIHCNENSSVPGDVYLPIRFPTGELIEASINVRPYAQNILEQLSKHFEVIVFTASHSCYANVVLDYLDPGSQWVSHRLFRESCVQTEEGAYIKDLRVLANRNLSDMLLIDNAAYSFGLQLGNGIPILPYYEDKQDQELLHLQTYLMQFRQVRDMRELNTRSLKIEAYADFNDPIELIQTLFSEFIH